MPKEPTPCTRASHQTNQQCSSPGVFPKFKALLINYSCCLTRMQSLQVGRAEVLPSPSCFKPPSSAKPGQGIPEEPPGASQEFHWSMPRHPVRATLQPLPEKPRRRNSALPSIFHLSHPPPSPGVIPTPGDLERTQSWSKQWTKYSGTWSGCSCRMHLPRPPRRGGSVHLPGRLIVSRK